MGPDRRPDALLDPDPACCECGVALDVHPPLPNPGPLRSWKAARDSVPTDVTWAGAPRDHAKRERADGSNTRRYTEAQRQWAGIKEGH